MPPQKQPPLERYVPATLGRALLAVAALLGLSAGLAGCAEKQSTAPASPASAALDGERLAEQHCGGCHLPASAASLDKKTWLENVLPAMAPKLGVNVMWGDKYYREPGAATAADSALSMTEWRKIVAYFEEAAPDTLHPDTLHSPRPARRQDLPLFTVRAPQWDRSRRPAATGLVAVDASARQIYSSDVTATTVHRWNQDLEPTAVAQPGLLGVDARFVKDSAGNRHSVLTSIGTMRAVDATDGEVRSVNLTNGSSRVIADGLPRPVCALPGDFNKDGFRDWVVCGFGHDTVGGLYLLTQQPGGTFERKTLRGVPGAVDAQVGDFNGDGWPDVMALFGHAREGVWLFTNDGSGGFESENVLQFPAVYGSSSLELADVNGDGRLDILYTSGDNADYSTILKPYHGVYVFTARGGGRYEEAYFYHLDGATEAVARDFDQDGDLDVGAIAFFANIEGEALPAQNFVYLEQQRSYLKQPGHAALNFTPHAPPLQRYGRWITMDAGDLDGDGDPDLVLGNFARRYQDQRDAEPRSNAHLPFIVLENQTRSPASRSAEAALP